MKAIRLEDIRSEDSEFCLKKTGQTYKLRMIDLDDEAWLKRNFGDELPKVFSEVRINDLCRILWRLMPPDEKKKFPNEDFEDIDEEGKPFRVTRVGIEVLKASISGVDEKIQILKALVRTIGISRPMMDEIEQDEAKRLEEEKKTPAMTESVGDESLTSSPPNMAGRSSRSRAARRAKSA